MQNFILRPEQELPEGLLRLIRAPI